jgi:extracellular elastinolytic metalloproteinase
MAREMDTRNFSFIVEEERTKTLFAAADAVSKSLPGTESLTVLAVNPFTGTPHALKAENAPVSEGSLTDRALAYMSVTRRAFGFAAGEPAEFVPDPHVMQTSAGTSVVNLHQYYHGIPVFDMVRAVRFSANKELTDAVGTNVNLPAGLPTMARLDAAAAVLAAAQHVGTPHEDEQGVKGGWGKPLTPVGVDLEGFSPRAVAVFSLPCKPTVLEKGPFEKEIPAHLTWFYQGPRARLGWHVMLTMPRYADQFAVIVSADETPGEILYCKRTVVFVKGRGKVYAESPGRTPRTDVSFPPAWADYPPVEGMAGVPPDWVAKDTTEGNNVVAWLGNDGPPYRGKLQGGLVVFDPQQEQGNDQEVLNIFYFTNYLHDFFFLLGFDEAHDNFQHVNYSGLGKEGDEVYAHAYNQEVSGVAYFVPTPEGEAPTMVMGLYGQRSTALDADVVFHEFTHGVTNRLVGGPMSFPSLEAPQSGGMGEGWSDYFALTMQNFGKSPERVVTGDWTVNDPRGIRRYPYDEHFPLNFGNVGKDDNDEVHNIGEIWCATLMEMNRNMTAALQSQPRAYRLAWQIVVDSFSLMPINPSFLNARDSMLRALDDLHLGNKVTDAEYTPVRKAMWSAFATYGMGAKASCPDAQLRGIKANFDLPPGI